MVYQMIENGQGRNICRSYETKMLKKIYIKDKLKNIDQN